MLAHDLSILNPDVDRSGSRSMLEEMKRASENSPHQNGNMTTAMALANAQKKGYKLEERNNLIDQKYQNLPTFDLQKKVSIPSNQLRSFQMIQKGDDSKYGRPSIHKSKLKY